MHFESPVHLKSCSGFNPAFQILVLLPSIGITEGIACVVNTVYISGYSRDFVGVKYCYENTFTASYLLSF